MLLILAIAIVCVLGIVGTLGSTSGYDRMYGQSSRRFQPTPRSVRRTRSFRRRSRQLQALEAALATTETEPAVPAPAPAHGRWSRA